MLPVSPSAAVIRIILWAPELEMGFMVELVRTLGLVVAARFTLYPLMPHPAQTKGEGRMIHQSKSGEPQPTNKASKN